MAAPQRWAARETVSGSLERVTHQVVTILRSDGAVMDTVLPADGKVRADVLTAKFKVGDIVEISYREITPVFHEEVPILQRFELERITLRHAPSRSEYASGLRSPAWRDPGNLLQPLDAASIPQQQGFHLIGAGASETEALERARETNLKRLANMPNFTADEIATRYPATSAYAKWDLLDVIKSDISFKGMGESREHVRQNDVPVDGGTRNLRSPGAEWRRSIRWNWGGSFNGRIRPIVRSRVSHHLPLPTAADCALHATD
jgi:hypothetical protein